MAFVNLYVDVFEVFIQLWTRDVRIMTSLAERLSGLLAVKLNAVSVGKTQQLLQGLQAVGDEGTQLTSVIEMCQVRSCLRDCRRWVTRARNSRPSSKCVRYVTGPARTVDMQIDHFLV